MDARSWDRHIVEKKIEYRDGETVGSAFLYDLSAGGCMLEFPKDGPGRGTRLELDLCRDQLVPGEVVWQVGGCAGVRFLAPIHEAVVRHLGFQPPPLSFDEQTPRDRFGRTLPPLDAGERRSAPRV